MRGELALLLAWMAPVSFRDFGSASHLIVRAGAVPLLVGMLEGPAAGSAASASASAEAGPAPAPEPALALALAADVSAAKPPAAAGAKPHRRARLHAALALATLAQVRPPATTHERQAW